MRIFILLLTYFITLELTAQISIDFTVNQTESCGSLQAIFTDNSTTTTGTIETWEWNLAGVFSDRQQPGRIFDTPGQYTICLKVTDTAGNEESLCKENLITIYKNPTANFKVDTRKGCAPLVSTFDDLSIKGDGNIINWTWDIGGSSNLINTQDPNLPIVTTYDTGGKYSVSLSIEDENGCTDVISKKDFVEVFDVPELILSRKLISICELPWEIDFKNENVDLGATYLWDFGNGQTYVGFDPPPTFYNERGVFDLSIIITKDGCVDTVKYEDYIDTDLAFTIDRNIENPCINEDITFSDNAEISVDSILWEFGDGTTSKSLSPIKSFDIAGCFDITVTRYFGDCVAIESYPCITINDLPLVDFTVENQFTCSVPVDVVVNGLNGGNYTWQMQDSDGVEQTFDSSSNAFTLTEFGQYTLTATYMDSIGCINSESNINIDIDQFSANLPNLGPGGCVPYTVELTDSIISTTNIISYDWSIPGLGIQSSERSPTFILEDTGQYDVILIVENEYGCIDTIVKTGYVQGGTIPQVDFVASPLVECLNIERLFNSITSDNVNYWIWDFGDNSFSNEKNPNHIYSDIGLFTVSLTAFYNGCTNTEIKDLYIDILKPLSSYEIIFNCDDPYTIDLNNLTYGADSLYWFFDDLNGKQDTLLDSIITSYTFNNTGRHVVGVYSKNDSTGCEHIRADTIEIVDLQPNYNVATYQGCVPLEVELNNTSQGYSTFSLSTDQSGVTIDSVLIKFADPGQYELPILTVEDIHGCIKTYQDTNKVLVNIVSANADYNPTVCVPDSITINSVSSSLFGQINFTEWNILDTTIRSDSLALFIDSIGIFTINLNVKDNFGCSDSIEISLEGINSTPDFTADTFGCVGSEITFIPTSQEITISEYTWDFGDGNTSKDVVPKHAYDMEGTYTVCLTISDLRGCVNQFCKEDYIIIANPKADFDGFPLQEECPPLLSNFNNLSLNAISYEWDFGDNSGLSYIEHPSHIYTEPGVFDVQLIAVRSAICKDTLKYDQYVELRGPKGDFSYDVIGNCLPLEVQLNANSELFYQYYYDFGNGVIDSSQTLVNIDQKSLFYNEPGTYTPKLIIADAAGCKRTFSADPIEVNDMTLDFSISIDPLCNVPIPIEVENTSISSTENINFEWILSQGIDSTYYYNQTLSTTIAMFGNYDLTLIGTTENCIDTIFKSDFINISGVPISEIGVPDIYCENNKLIFTNGSSISNGTIDQIEWKVNGISAGSKDSLITEFNVGNHQVELEVISKAGCKSSKEIEFSVLENPKATLSTNNIICRDESAILNANLEDSISLSMYNWSDENGVICAKCTNIEVAPGITTTYYYALQNNNGCSYNDSLVLNVAPVNAPQVTLSQDTIICIGDEAELSIVDFNNDYIYNWITEGVECLSDCEVTIVSPTQFELYIIEAMNEFGCLGLDTTVIDVEASIPEFLTDEKFICEGNLTDLEVQNVNNPVWFDNGVDICNNCQVLTVQPDSDQYYYVYVESDLGCTYNDSIKVNVIPLESVEAGENQQICNGETITLSGIGIGNPIWSPAEHLSNYNTFNPEASPDQSQMYYLNMTKGECILNDSVEIEVIYKVDIDAIGDTVCFNEEGNITATGDAFFYDWYSNDIPYTATQEFKIIGEKSINFQVIGSRTTCENDTAYAYFKVHPKIEFDIEEDKIKSYYNSRIKIRPTYDLDRNYSFSWSPSTGLSCDNCPNPLIKGIQEQIDYEVLITDEDTGCNIKKNLKVNLKEECNEMGFFIPNIFSPNNDGINEFFFINAGDPEEFISINILNRWGNVLFRSEDPNFTWDGLFNGEEVNPGVYIYHINAYCPATREVYQFSGDITIIH